MHCLAGISRSVTVTVAYLMQKLNLSLNDAYDFVKRKKSNISPNFNFMGQLLDFERTLGLNSPTCDNRSPKDQMFFTTPTNHNVFQLDTLESTWNRAEMNVSASRWKFYKCDSGWVESLNNCQENWLWKQNHGNTVLAVTAALLAFWNGLFSFFSVF